MNKDVIYIDVDDDVTAIIGKIKDAKEKIVAVVPPKRVGTLQSAVNLRLLDRMAKADKKQLVLITGNQALVALAANASIPVAKNLQSKPEIAEIPALVVDDGDDVIDGSDLPVGEHVDGYSPRTSSDEAESKTGRSQAVDSVDLDDDDQQKEVAAAVAGVASTSGYGRHGGYGKAVTKKTASPRGKTKIPNFDKFRKKLFFGVGGAILLVALLIWMFVFAPAATVIVTAATSPAPVSSTIKLGTTEATDYSAGIVKASSQQDKKDAVLEFDVTGQKDLGTPATGTVKFSTNNISNLGTTIPAGTKLTSSSGVSFTTDNDVTITVSNYNGANTTITAVDNGTNYNGATGSVSGAPSGISASLVGATGNGTSNIVKVATSDDVDRARGQLIGQSTDSEKKSLAAKFTNGEKIIDNSFTIDRGAEVVTPAVGQQANDGKAKITIPTTYTLYAIATNELETYLNSSLKSQLNDPNTQKIYSTGIDKLGFSNYSKEGDTATVAITTTGQIGPKIDENQIKDQVKGKIYGEVQSTLQSIEGVKDVDVKFSYPWVHTVPKNTNKITIEFKLQNE